MDWRPVLVVAGGAGAFVALALAGALLIVNLAPGEQPVSVADKGLLMERASTLQPFDARPAQTPQPPAVVERPPPPPPAAAPPKSPDLLAMLREDPPPAAASGPNLTAIVPAAPKPTRKEPPRPVVAVALPPRALPEARYPAAPVPLIRPRPEPRADGVLTPSAIRQFRFSLRLTPEQEPYWFPVQQALSEIGTQQAAMVRAGQDPKEAFGVSTAMRIYSVARPLLDALREDQKARVRAQARSMGFASIASQI